MTWTYSGDPTTSDLDEVRFLSGDIEEAYSFVSDEEVAYALMRSGTPRAAAVKVCRAILRKLAMQADYTIGPETVKASQRLEHFKLILKDLLSDVSGSDAVPTMHNSDGGCIFGVGMHDNRG